MRVRVKICGITTVAAGRAAAAAGADAVGFVFAESPRQVTIDEARKISAELPPFVTRVAVFRHPEPAWVAEIVAAVRPDVVQSEPSPDLDAVLDDATVLLPVLHDDPDLLDAVREQARARQSRAILLEAPGRGGRGVAPDWQRAAQAARETNLVLAGGLHPENVADAIRQVGPYGVDVSSGVEERPGVKSADRIAAFIDAVHRATTRTAINQETP